MINEPHKIPAVSNLLSLADTSILIEQHGLRLVTICAQRVLSDVRKRICEGISVDNDTLSEMILDEVSRFTQPSLRRVFNLTGVILHTNLGRAQLPESALEAIINVAKDPTNLEFDLHTGKRGDRHEHTEELLCYLTGAEASIIVNNNAAAVLLTLNSLAKRKEVLISRGELVEIGGSYRMPDIIVNAGCKLVEVGTTNCTHEADFERALGPKTAILMKVHPSNFEVRGFTRSVSNSSMARIAKSANLPFVTDLGSGLLTSSDNNCLRDEMTVVEVLRAGADLATFSGDKLLGGPQAGIIVGRIDLIKKLKRNPMMRALRPDKMTIAALEAVLKLHTNPKQLRKNLPTMRFMSRDFSELKSVAARIAPELRRYCNEFCVTESFTQSQVGSGALPTQKIDSFGLKITPIDTKNKSSKKLTSLAYAFRNLPIPVVGRISADALWLDLRCLEDEPGFIENIKSLKIK